MQKIAINFSESTAAVKRLNAVNNGPISSVRNIGTSGIFQELQIPYSRLHDSSFCASYGGEYTVDVHRIFRNFDADENEAGNYFFEATDKYIKNILETGTKVFYRLGASIEHGIKKGTYPPKDFLKWAKICEHIIKHYNNKWADGFEYGIEYWEIWNEPDCKNADGSNPCWQGSEQQFIDFYTVVAKYLKKVFPTLKIGGPAFCNIWQDAFVKRFLQSIKDNGTPLDFLSYHWYGKRISDFKETINKVSDMLNEYGLGDREKILNEWNYVDGWLDKEFISTIQTIKGQKGASFVCAAMCEAQNSDLDMLMYYDARPCAFCGIFNTDSYIKLKTFNTFAYFNELVKCGKTVKTEFMGEGLYGCCAKGKDGACLLFTRFSEHEEASCEEVEIELNNYSNDYRFAEIFVSDENRDNYLIERTDIKPENNKIYVETGNYALVFVKFYR